MNKKVILRQKILIAGYKYEETIHISKIAKNKFLGVAEDKNMGPTMELLWRWQSFHHLKSSSVTLSSNCQPPEFLYISYY